MPSSYSPLLRATLPADGELVGTWGQTVNNGVTSLLESAIAGTAVVAMTDADYTLTTANGAADEARQMVLRLTGALTANRSVICPTSSKLYFVRNATAGGFSIVFKTASGTGITVRTGEAMLLYCDGTNVVDAFNAATNVNALSGAFTNSLTLGGVSVATTAALGNYLPLSGGTLTGTLAVGSASNAANINLTAQSDGNNGILRTLASNGTSITQMYSVAGGGFVGTVNAMPLVLLTTNTERMRIDASGRVGIGTADPSIGGGRMVVQHASNNGLVVDSLGGASTIYLRNAADATPSKLQFMQGNGLSFADQNGNERLRIDTSGNVGIGNNALPSTALHVQRTGNSEVRVSTYTSGDPRLTLNAEGVNGGSVRYSRANQQLVIEAAGTDAMIVSTAGQVGIGRTPGYALDVAGTVRSIVSGGAAYLLGDAQNTVAIRSIPGAGDTSLGFFTQALSGNAERMRIDASGNVGIGATPSAWNNNYKVLQLGSGGWLAGRVGSFGMETGSNWYRDGAAAYVRISTDAPTFFGQETGQFIWSNAPAGAAGSSFTFSTRMVLDANGNLGIGTSSVPAGRRLAVVGGAVRIDADTNLEFGGSSAGLYGNSASNYVVAFTNTTERMRIDSSGNVGIGITPSNRLHAGGITRISDATNSTAVLIDPVTTAGLTSITAQFGGSQLAFGTAGTERMRIDGSGNATFTGEVTLSRQSSTEGGQLNLNRGLDNIAAWAIDVQGATSTPSLRFINTASGPTVALTIDGANAASFVSSVTATSFSGSGASLTALNASQLTSGTVPDARFPATLPAVSGANLTSLNASNLGSGTVPAARIGSTTAYAVGDASTVGGLAIGYRNIPRGADQTINTAKVGRVVVLTAGATIPSATFAADDTIALYNNSAAAITITQGASLTMYGPNASTGNRTLAARGWATIWFNTANECKITGEVT